MVKGTTRRVVVIKSPDPKIFDEAIFIVREDAAKKGVTGAQIINEAQSTAHEYIMKNRPPVKNPFQALPPQFFTIFGAAAVGLVWLFTSILS